MSISPTMTSRAGTLPIAKVSSSENICAKAKEDRKRSTFYKHSGTFNQESSNTPQAAARYNNGKGANNHFQKQPRSKSGIKNSGGRRNQVKAERRDAFSPLPVEQHGSKKTNMNHLLNFTFDSSYDDHRHVQRGRTSQGWKYAGKPMLFNKEQFIQANCQLVVKEGPDYGAYFADADVPIDWELVEKVNMWSHETPLCPICLESPNAAKVTKCGHIYCFPCILHYLTLDTRPWRKCPICHEAVQKNDLKSVSVYEDQFYDPQSIITMRLMKRQKGSMLAFPADENNDLSCVSELNSFVGNTKTQAMSKRNFKFLHAAPGQVITHIIQVEMEQLEIRFALETDELEKQFILAAMDLCKQRQADLLLTIKEKHVSENSETYTENSDRIDDATESAVHENNSNNCPAPEMSTQSSESDATPESPSEHVYYFYQAKDGQNIYLHPVNVKCLIHEYGSFDQCPMEITGKILETEDHTMNEAMRKRHRYLAHLPLTLEFHVAELDLRPPLVQRSTLDAFCDHLERRAAQRKKKVREEKKVQRQVHNEQMRKQGKYPAARISLESQKQFPNFPSRSGAGPSSFSVLLPAQCDAAPSVDIPEVRSDASLSPLAVSASSSFESAAGPSFAQMLKNTRAADRPAWPRVGASASQTSQTSVTSSNDVDDDDPDYVAPPSYQSSFGDALSSALSRLDAEADEAGERGRGKKAKGKKKGKKVLLFSTAGHQQH